MVYVNLNMIVNISWTLHRTYL